MEKGNSANGSSSGQRQVPVEKLGSQTSTPSGWTAGRPQQPRKQTPPPSRVNWAGARRSLWDLD